MSTTISGLRCLCPEPDTHPAGEEITLPDKLGFRQLATATSAIRWHKLEHPDAGVPELIAMLEELYLTHCLESWSLQAREPKSGKLQPVPLTQENVQIYLLSEPDVALEVAEVCDRLYSSTVLVPLVREPASSSQAGQTDGSTSPTNGAAHPRRRKRSSTTTSRTGVTAQTAQSL